MKTIFTITCLLLLVFAANAQNHLDVEGHAKIRGNIDINHMDDTTSLYIGREAGMITDFSVRRFNTFVGSNAGLKNTIGNANSFFGRLTGGANTTGGYNAFFGTNAGLDNTEGSFNSFFGSFAGRENTIGIGNSFFGYQNGFNNTEGRNNSFFGLNAGYSNTTGEENSSFGRNAGSLPSNSTRNTFVGVLADQLSADSLDRAIAIGYNAKVNCSHCAVIGGTGEDTVNVGLGTPNPQSKLEIRGTGAELTIKSNDINQDNSGSIVFDEGNGEKNFRIQYDGATGDGGGRLTFKDFNIGALLTIVRAGNVGIGTTEPLQKLHIVGNRLRIASPANAGKFIDFRTDGNALDIGSTGGRLFLLGNGGEGVIIQPNSGNVGIGTETPTVKLDVKGTTSVGVPGDGNILLNLNSDRNWSFKQRNTGASTALELASIGGGGGKSFIINTIGPVGIGTTSPVHPLQMGSGAHVTSGGVWTNSSSRALKENISDLTVEEAISTIRELNPVKFNYKLQKEEKYIGFIAEDVPELVSTQDRKSLSPMDIVAVLTKVVQYQQQRIDILNEKDSELNSLKREMIELKRLLKTQIENASED